MNGRPLTTLHVRTWPSAVTTQRTCMLPSMPRSIASGVYSGAGPEIISGAVICSSNSTAFSRIAAGVGTGATEIRTRTLPPLIASVSGAYGSKPSRRTASEYVPAGSQVISNAPDSSVIALCSPTRDGLRAITTASLTGACVSASTTTPVSTAMGVCAAMAVPIDKTNASAARRIGFLRDPPRKRVPGAPGPLQGLRHCSCASTARFMRSGGNRPCARMVS